MVCELYFNEIVIKEVYYLYLVTNNHFSHHLKCLWPLLNITGKNASWAQLFWKRLWRYLTKLCMYLLFDPEVPLQEIHLEDVHPAKQQYIWTRLFTAALFVTAKCRNNINVNTEKSDCQVGIASSYLERLSQNRIFNYLLASPTGCLIAINVDSQYYF